jgi:signal transduction histidine kinase
MHTSIQQARILRSTALREDLPDSPTAQAVIAYLAESALSCLDVYGLFDLATELITEVLDVEFIEILHQPEPGEALVLEAGGGWSADVTLGETTVPSDQGSQAGYTLMAGAPVLVEDLATEERFEGPPLLLDHGVVSGITVVIPGEFRPYGVLGVHAREHRHFTDEEGHFLRSAANILGGARENIRTRLQIERDAIARERRIQYHAALAKCAESLLASGGEHRLDNAVEALLAASRASSVFVDRNFVDPELGLSSRTVAESVQPGTPGYGMVDTYWDAIPWARMPTTRKALEAGECISLVPSEIEGPEYDVYAEDPIGVVSEIDVPIFVNGEWVGLIGLAEREMPREWTEEDRSLLTAAATMIGAYWERDGARDALLEMVRSKDLFLASVSHELRTPITAVVGTSEILRDESLDLSDEERAELLDMVVSEGTDLVNIVSDLLAAAKADSGTLTVSQVSVSLRAQAAQVFEGIHQDSDSPIEISGESMQGVGDPDRVRQIVRNLVTNAQRYGGDTIRVELARENDRAILRVIDDGAGVAEVDRERIFEPYASAHGANAHAGSIGLGLAISRKLARLMGGDLTYRYQDGESIFELTLRVPD